MKIYLDFDDTILNTGAFKNELERILRLAGFGEEDFVNNWKKTKDDTGDFDLDYFFNLFVKSGGFDVVKTRRTVDTLFANVDVFVYEDFFDFVKEFDKEKLAVISFGTTPFQREKIENAKIVPHFSEVIVTPHGKEESFKNIVKEHVGKKIFFVDDRVYQIDKVKETTPDVTVIKMERPEGRYSSEKSDMMDYTAKDFHEIEKIIKDNL